MFTVCAVGCVYIAAMIDTFTFRGDSLTVLGQKQSPTWQSTTKPQSWFDERVDLLGYVSYDGVSTIGCLSRLQPDGDVFVADFSDLQINDGTHFEEVLAASTTYSLFGRCKRQYAMSMCGTIDRDGRFQLSVRLTGVKGDTVYELIPERDRIFRLAVIERTLTGARTCDFRFRLENNGKIHLI